MFTISEKALEYFNKEAFYLINLAETTEDVKEQPSSERGSLAHKVPFELTGLIDSPFIITRGWPDSTVSMKECYKGKCIGFNEENYIRFIKFCKSVYKEKSVSNLLSLSFVEKQCFAWVVSTIRNQKADKNFVNFFLEKAESSTKEYNILYLILNLEIVSSFKIGLVEVNFLTKEYFDNLEKLHQSKQSKDKDAAQEENPYSHMRQKYQGGVFCTYTVRAEALRAKQIALEACSLAVDVLKMCSITTEMPNEKLNFDIDCRVRENQTNEVLTMNKEEEGSFVVDMYSSSRPFVIDSKMFSYMNARGLGLLNFFLLKTVKKTSELDSLIINSIKRYADAMSVNNFHQRVVQLFTILESLLLLDNNSPIIESVCKYGSKLILKGQEERKEFIGFIKKCTESEVL